MEMICLELSCGPPKLKTAIAAQTASPHPLTRFAAQTASPHPLTRLAAETTATANRQTRHSPPAGPAALRLEKERVFQYNLIVKA